MPVWHDETRAWVNAGQLVVLGVTQEQHAERGRLFAQWKQLDWPIVHDPLNLLGSKVVPVAVAIDEHGIIRSTQPDPRSLEAEFLRRSFADDATNSPAELTPQGREDWKRIDPSRLETSGQWRAQGDAAFAWGGEPGLDAAIESYRKAVVLDPREPRARFRLGVALRRRSETDRHQKGDFQEAVEAWGLALELDPNQYIWRRRIQQFGPRLDKPYPFYDWVAKAEATVRSRGEMPVAIPVRPDGAEIASPIKNFESAPDVDAVKSPDPLGKLARDQGAVTCEATVVPAVIEAGQTGRVHLQFRLKPRSTEHWNHEGDPLQVWIEPASEVEVSERLVTAERRKSATSVHDQTIGFEIRVPKEQTVSSVRVSGYATYALCDEAGGPCRFLRLDWEVNLKTQR